MSEKREYVTRHGLKVRLNTPDEDASITAAARQDPDNPPLSDEELTRMRPVKEAMPEMLRPHRKRGRPPGRTKERVTIRLDKDVVAFFKGGDSKGWQSRLNEALRKYMNQAG
ncbi:MAG: BrnA antitoxin family protein [Sphingomonadales bacterium]